MSAARLCALLAALVLAGCWPPPVPPPPRPPPPAPEPPPPTPVEPSPESSCQKIQLLEIYKSERRLEAWCWEGVIVRMRVALGRTPIGRKRTRGDYRTPEGVYQVAAPARPSTRFHRFIPIDYPSRADAMEARVDGKISQATYREIVEAHNDGRSPPQHTSMGGDLGIHGEGQRWRGFSRNADWTYGCVAVSDAEVDFLAERLEPGTPVLIYP